MKHYFVLIALSMWILFSYAQENSLVANAAKSAFWSRVHIGLKGGFTATNVNINVRDASLDDYGLPTAEKFNWRVGVDASFDAFDNFFIRTGLEYVNKGFNVDLDKLKDKYSSIASVKGQWTTFTAISKCPLILATIWEASN